jgi:excisionase family DNA binding protein
MDTQADLLKTKEVAAELRVCRNTVYNLIKRKCFKAHKVGPRSWRIEKDSFEVYKAALRATPEAATASV